MSCDKCDEVQGQVRGIGGQYAYVRVGKANIMIVGCEEHLRDIIAKLRFADEAGWQEFRSGMAKGAAKNGATG